MKKHLTTDIKTITIDNLQLIGLPVLSDNYTWLVIDLDCPVKSTTIIDPGEFNIVNDYIKENNLTPVNILLTHHHYDHTDGVPSFIEYYPSITVYGPEETQIKGAQQIVQNDQIISLHKQNCHVISTPGHTLGHVSYYLKPFLFSGDCLFSAGCGRLFEGSPEEMFNSISILAALPDETLVCAAHEYTAANLKFAQFIFPGHQQIDLALNSAVEMNKNGISTLPSTIETEKKINPYIICKNNHINQNIIENYDHINSLERFKLIRKLKDNF